MLNLTAEIMADDILVSVSQISMFKACPRSWYWKYVMKTKEPYRPWLNTGINFHLCIEHAYKKIKGEKILTEKTFDSDIVDMVNIGFKKKILTIPNIFLLEHNIKFPVCEGAYLKGVADFINVSDGKIEDHKTISSWQYAETEETLKNNFQLLVYAKWYLDKVKNRNSIVLKHNQFHKNAPDTSRSVEVKVSRKYVMDNWETNALPYIKQMVALKKNTDENAFEFNQDACGNYGGCSFTEICHGFKGKK